MKRKISSSKVQLLRGKQNRSYKYKYLRIIICFCLNIEYWAISVSLSTVYNICYICSLKRKYKRKFLLFEEIVWTLKGEISEVQFMYKTLYLGKLNLGKESIRKIPTPGKCENWKRKNSTCWSFWKENFDPFGQGKDIFFPRLISSIILKFSQHPSQHNKGKASFRWDFITKNILLHQTQLLGI